MCGNHTVRSIDEVTYAGQFPDAREPAQSWILLKDAQDAVGAHIDASRFIDDMHVVQRRLHVLPRREHPSRDIDMLEFGSLRRLAEGIHGAGAHLADTVVIHLDFLFHVSIVLCLREAKSTYNRRSHRLR